VIWCGEVQRFRMLRDNIWIELLGVCGMVCMYVPVNRLGVEIIG